MNRYENSQPPYSKCISLSALNAKLARAVVKRHPSKVRNLLSCNVDFVDSNQKQIQALPHQLFEDTVDILESQASIIEILKLLLDNGANVNSRDNHQETVLHLAVAYRLTRVIDFLISRHVDLHERDSSGNSILHFLIKEELNTFLNKCHMSKTLEILLLERKSVDFIKWMILKGLDVDCQNNRGDTVLHLAAKNNLLHALPILLKHTRDVTIVNDDNMTAFQIFAASVEKFFDSNNARRRLYEIPDLPMYGDVSAYVCEIYETFLNKGFSADVVDESGCTPVHHALKQVRCGHGFLFNNILELMLKHFTKVDAQDKFGMTPLHCAIRYATTEIVARLLELGANVNSKEFSQKHTPLHEAVEYNREDLLRVLIDHGADVNARTKKGQTPLHLIKTTKKNVIEKLLEVATRIDVNSRDSVGGYTPLHEAVAYDREDLLELLIDNGADINARTNAGQTVLHLVMTSKKSAIQKLIELDDDIDVNSRESISGHTPLHMAVMYGRTDLLLVLVDNGADVNARTNKGQTALHLAINSNKFAVEELIKYGAHVDVTDDDGFQPLHKAILRKDSYAMKILLEFGADINDTTHVLDVNNYLPVSEFIIKHLIKLQAADLPIDEKLTGFLEYTSNADSIYKSCFEEIISMKSYKISNRTSLYNLLRKNRNAKCAYVKNETLNELMGNAWKLRKQFPMYHVLISSAYFMALDRIEMLESAKQAWYELVGTGLPDLCLDKILCNLSNASLRCMIEGVNDASYRQCKQT